MYERGSQGEISKFWIIFLICCYLAVFTDWGIEVFGHPLPDSTNTFLMMGYAKAAITFVKYLPQVYLNWKRQSVDGFSIENVVLDFTGGSLSFA
jgi:cystinosin